MLTRTNLVWGLLCALALVIGLIAGRQGLVGQSANELPSANFRADFPLKQIREKTFKNETVQLDGNEFINCTFDNVIFEFDGQAPFRLTNAHFEKQSKITIKSNNPVVKSTLEIVAMIMKLENSIRSNENK